GEETHFQLRQDVGIVTQMIEQPYLKQLVIRHRVEPQLDRVEMHAELNQLHRRGSDVPRPTDRVRPVIPPRVLAGALSKVAGKLVWRRQLSPHQSKGKGN